MHAQTWAQKELKLIDPRYFAVWDTKNKCFRVRKWYSTHPIDQKLSLWESRSDNIAKLPPYEEINMAFVESMREGFYWARNAKMLLQEIDESNAKLEESEAREQDYMARYMAKEIYRIYREPRIILSGREWQR
jgi:hypothetical protein